MKQFNSFETAKAFVDSLAIPIEEIDQEHTGDIFRLGWYDVRLKWADCDIIRIHFDYDEKTFKKYWKVQKYWFGGPISASEAFGMTPARYKTPNF